MSDEQKPVSTKVSLRYEDDPETGDIRIIQLDPNEPTEDDLMRRDAARYRWIKANAHSVNFPVTYIDSRTVMDHIKVSVTGGGFDKWVDAAIQRVAEEKRGDE